MKVLLINPTSKILSVEAPLGLMYIASMLRQHGHTAKIIEGEPEEILRQFSQLPFNEPDFIGITCMTSQYHNILKIRDFIHRWRQKWDKQLPIIFGGPHSSVLPESLISKGDYVVIGEGEQTVLDILDGKHSDGIVQGKLIENLDELPFPARDLIPKNYLSHHRTSILASRGCAFNCSFCQPTLRKIFGSKVRRRSPRNVLLEMVSCLNDFGIAHFQFFDDTFTSNKQWIYEFCQFLKIQNIVNRATHHFPFCWDALSRVDTLDYDLLKNMKEAGLKKLGIGFESGSQEILNSYCKGVTVEQGKEAVKMCKRLGIKVHGYFMVGALDETAQTLEATKRFIMETKPDTIFVTVTTPMPCTRLYEEAKSENRLCKEWQDFDLLGSLAIGSASNSDNTVVMNLKHLTHKHIIEARFDILKSFYMRKARNPLFVLNFIHQHGFDYTWNLARRFLRGD